MNLVLILTIFFFDCQYTINRQWQNLHVIRREVIENLIFTGHIEDKRSKGRQQVINLMNLSELIVD